MSDKLPITVVIPVRNEEANLPACLANLSRFDEVLIVDSGSTDRTLDIAAEHGIEVVQFEWNGQFPKKRNWILMNKSLRNDWVLFLDADEHISDEFCDEAAKAIAQDRYAGFWLHYTNYFLGKALNHGDPQRKLALFKVGKGLFEKIDEDAWTKLDMEVHEHPIIEGEVGAIHARIDHRDDRGIVRFVDRHKDYAMWEAKRTTALRAGGPEVWDRLTERQKKKYANIDKWWFAWSYFLWTFVAKGGFLDGYTGLSYAMQKLHYFMMIRSILIEMKNAEPG